MSRLDEIKARYGWCKRCANHDPRDRRDHGHLRSQTEIDALWLVDQVEWLERWKAEALQEDVEEYDAILTRQSDLLTRTVNALRGNPPSLTSWSHHDIPELAAEKVSEVARLTAERDALRSLLSEFVDDEPCWLDHHGYCQSHYYFGEDECYMARARAAIAGSEADTTDTQSTDQEDQS